MRSEGGKNPSSSFVNSHGTILVIEMLIANARCTTKVVRLLLNDRKPVKVSVIDRIMQTNSPKDVHILIARTHEDFAIYAKMNFSNIFIQGILRNTASNKFECSFVSSFSSNKA
ncbi:hypothetical protein STEG23_010880, partial [Scotinomys teguina]